MIQCKPQNIQFNPIHKIFIQSNPQNIYSIQSTKYLFNPIHKIFIQSNPQNIAKYLFNLPGASAAALTRYQPTESVNHTFPLKSCSK